MNWILNKKKIIYKNRAIIRIIKDSKQNYNIFYIIVFIFNRYDKYSKDLHQ